MLFFLYYEVFFVKLARRLVHRELWGLDRSIRNLVRVSRVVWRPSLVCIYRKQLVVPNRPAIEREQLPEKYMILSSVICDQTCDKSWYVLNLLSTFIGVGGPWSTIEAFSKEIFSADISDIRRCAWFRCLSSFSVAGKVKSFGVAQEKNVSVGESNKGAIEMKEARNMLGHFEPRRM